MKKVIKEYKVINVYKHDDPKEREAALQKNMEQLARLLYLKKNK